MPRLSPLRCRPILAALLAVGLCASVVSAASDGPSAPKAPPVPAITLPLETYGYKPAENRMSLEAGFTNATVHFIDSETVLLTYGARKLLRRLPDQQEGDDDHAMIAEVIHLPDGKVLREAEFRLHDRKPYLWPLADGRFLLRVRNTLYTLHPLGSENPDRLGERLLMEPEGDLQGLQFSPERDLMLVETVPAAKIGDDPAEHRDNPVTANFYQLRPRADGSVALVRRGRAQARSAFTMAFTSLGLLETVQEDRIHWGFDFHPYKGKPMELAGFTSSCRPHSVFLSETEFFAFGCRGGADRKLMGGFNLSAEAKWVFTTDDEPLWLAVDASPSTGRFAVRNTLTTVDMAGSDTPSLSEIKQQEVRVYGGREGDELLRLTVSPAQRPAGNFALSPDGLRVAVLRGPNLEIYALPPVPASEVKLQEKQRAALAPLRQSEEADIAAAIAAESRSAP